jgi:hypothetical protein
VFNKVFLAIEKTKASSADIIITLHKLKANLSERQDNKYIPQASKKKISRY